MEVAFEDSKLQELIEIENRLIRKFGASAARKIQIRMTQLRAAACFTELRSVPGRWHELSAERTGQWAADAGHPKRVIVRPTPPAPMHDDGGHDWDASNRVTVVSVVDYH